MTTSLPFAIYRRQRAARARLHNFLLRRRLKQHTDFSYTTDYVSAHVDNWMRWLGAWRGQPGLRILEIGSYQGRSAVWFLQNILIDPTATLDCIDLFTYAGLEPRFDHNVKLTGRASQINKHKGRSEDILPRLSEAHFNAIYVDGSHHAADVLMDAMLSWRLLKAGGVMFFDDYLWRMDLPPAERPHMAVDLFLKAHSNDLEVIHHDYQVAVRRRPASSS
jgi:predicted O-methyltransferase YrrM